jgi:glycosyltransferase involved in cell wall biosynthesis
MTAPAIYFLFKSARLSRLEESGPREFFYGFTELSGQDLLAEILEEDSFQNPLPVLVERAATWLLGPLAGLNAAMLARLGSRAALEKLNRASALVATTNAQGLALGALKELGRLKPPVLFLPMGVWPLKTGRLRSHFLARWLRHLSLAPISKTETRWLEGKLSNHPDLSYLPFGVDARFWAQGTTAPAEDYVFAIGNDANRDWALLAQSWTADLPRLRIVTRKAVPSHARIDVMAGDWNQRTLSDLEIRALYQKSRFVVLPLKDTIQPAGQSACLQAMACGKAVILSAIQGLWDEELLIDGQTCLLVPPGDAAALRAAALRLAADSALAERLGQAACERVVSRFSIERIGDDMAKRLQHLIGGGP